MCIYRYVYEFMEDLFKTKNTDFDINIMRTVRDDISLTAVQSALYINKNKNNIKRRSFRVDYDTHIDGDGVILTSEYIESFIDALAKVYADNITKINGYQFIITYANGNSSLPYTALKLMAFCVQAADECGISIDKIAFGYSTAVTGDNNISNINVNVYIAPFSIASKKSVQISRWNKFRLFVKELYRIIVSK